MGWSDSAKAYVYAFALSDHSLRRRYLHTLSNYLTVQRCLASQLHQRPNGRRDETLEEAKD